VYLTARLWPYIDQTQSNSLDYENKMSERCLHALSVAFICVRDLLCSKQHKRTNLKMNLSTIPLVFDFDLAQARFEGQQAALVVRHLSDMRGYFLDDAAFERMIEFEHDPILYTVSNLEHWSTPGDLHIGIGKIMPGRVGDEYFMTKGHLHQWRDAAEIYIGLSGTGMMMLEDERDGDSTVLPLAPNQVVYVPGHTAHRTINIGNAPLIYMGIFSATAGHDYGSIATENFRQVVVERNGVPVVLLRSALQSPHKPASGA
jgi:glucose-6-phosphate isomerase, archaeal